jgi:putative membrane-bound dehydrogenase-like protein
VTRCSCCFPFCVLLSFLSPVHAEPPRVADKRLAIDLIAEQPDIVTPTGVAVDETGRVWVIENHTHQRPDNYTGPKTDRVRIFSAFDEHGRATKVHTFAEGFRNAMSLALRPDGTVFLATRSDIYTLRDKSGKGVADERKVIVKLDSTGDYPHNGLAGFAFDPLGNVYFALGENLGAPYKMIGSDKTTLSGGGEGGSIYRVKPDGTGLTRIATGFWNTFHLTFDAFGRLFAVDNDPDSRGPCRLLHIIPGGDYGYRFRNGRKGLHPFTAWDGELPGTLPMVAGTAEAPSGIVAYEGTGLPAEYRGQLLVTSWGDHVIERFQLEPRGASFGAKMQVLVRGGEDFRPVGIVAAPDGSLVVSDWVDKSYPVHGKGRLWRIRWKDAPPPGPALETVAKMKPDGLRKLLAHPRIEVRFAAGEALAARGGFARPYLNAVLSKDMEVRARLHALWVAAQLEPAAALPLLDVGQRDAAPEVRAEAVRLFGLVPGGARTREEEVQLLGLAQYAQSPGERLQALGQLRTDDSLRGIVPKLADADPFIMSTALSVLGQTGKTGLLLPHIKAADPRLRLGVLLALRQTGDVEVRPALSSFLSDADPAVRRAAIQWVGEERLREHVERIRTAASQAPTTRDLLEALLAADALLNPPAKSGDETAGQDLVARIVADETQPGAFRALGLRMLRPDHPSLKISVLEKYLKEPVLGHEAARALVSRGDPAAQDLLRRLAGDSGHTIALRLDAVRGLAHSAADSKETQQVLLGLLKEQNLSRDVLRSLRSAAGNPDVEAALLGWWETRVRGQGRTTPENRELSEQVFLAVRSSKTPAVQKRLTEIRTFMGESPGSVPAWYEALRAPGNPAVGERVFYHVNGPRCSACHQIDGRGAAIGPDLSLIGRATSRDKLIESILEPSKEIAPRFTTWQITTKNGKVRACTIVSENFDSTVTVADATGKLEVIRRLDIEERTALPTSIMPANLSDLMTRQDFLDLLAFLAARK